MSANELSFGTLSHPSFHLRVSEPDPHWHPPTNIRSQKPWIKSILRTGQSKFLEESITEIPSNDKRFFIGVGLDTEGVMIRSANSKKFQFQLSRLTPNSISWADLSPKVALASGYLSAGENKLGLVTIWNIKPPPQTHLYEKTPIHKKNPEKVNITYNKESQSYLIQKGDTLIGEYPAEQNPDADEIRYEYGITSNNDIIFCEHKIPPIRDWDADDYGLPSYTTSKLKLLSSKNGKILSTSPNFKLERDSTILLSAKRHPKENSLGILFTGGLTSWNISDNSLYFVEDRGPRDYLGWSGNFIFTSQSSYIYAGLKRKLLRLSWPELKNMGKAIYHESIVSSLALSNDGKYLISSSGFLDGAGSQGYAQVWKLPEFSPVGPRLKSPIQLENVEFLDGDRVFMTFGSDASRDYRRFWHAETTLPLTVDYLERQVRNQQARLPLLDYLSRNKYGEYMDLAPNRTIKEVPQWFYNDFLTLMSKGKIGTDGHYKLLSAVELSDLSKKTRTFLKSAPESRFTKVAKTLLQIK